MNKITPVLFLILVLSGCAPAVYVKPTPPVNIPGVYHRVEKGQTLWRISKLYAADLDEIAQFNRIPDISSIEVGQLIFIPNRQKPQYTAGQFAADDFNWPVKGKVIATFGQSFDNMINKGINIQPYGNPDVVAARAGKVIFCSEGFGRFGKTIIIDHGDGLSTVYARNAQILIKAADIVQGGSLIAKAGSVGRQRNTYLHFEIRKKHAPQNPFFYLPR